MQLFRKPGDYEAFERSLEKTLETCPLRICSYTLMPNHWHLVVCPERDGDLAPFLQKLTITHVRNWPLPRDWLRIVAGVQPKRQLELVRRSLLRGQPYGSETWTQRTAAVLELQSTLRPRGRPKKPPDDSPQQ